MNSPRDLLARVEAYIASYVSFANPDYAFVGALWAAATHFWPHFDVFPYMVVTSETKQSGKTLFGIDLMDALTANAVKAGGMTPAVCFRTVHEEKPTLLVDEAETLNSEAASDLRAALNMGYKRGAKFRRVEGRKPVEYNVYCPKLFVLIGDVYDTLHDRSIIIKMQRGKPGKRYVRSVAEADGHALRDEMADFAEEHAQHAVELYHNHKGLEYLSSRDEEIWLPLFVVCETLAPHMMDRLLRVAVDLAAEKLTTPRRSYIKLLGEGVEERKLDDEFARRLLADLLAVMNHADAPTLRAYKGKKGGRYVLTVEALAKLYEIPEAPWRRYRGTGLTDRNMGDMLDRFGVHPKSIKTAPGKVQRGYREEDVAAALARVNG